VPAELVMAARSADERSITCAPDATYARCAATTSIDDPSTMPSKGPGRKLGSGTHLNLDWQEAVEQALRLVDDAQQPFRVQHRRMRQRRQVRVPCHLQNKW